MAQKGSKSICGLCHRLYGRGNQKQNKRKLLLKYYKIHSTIYIYVWIYENSVNEIKRFSFFQENICWNLDMAVLLSTKLKYIRDIAICEQNMATSRVKNMSSSADRE